MGRMRLEELYGGSVWPLVAATLPPAYTELDLLNGVLRAISGCTHLAEKLGQCPATIKIGKVPVTLAWSGEEGFTVEWTAPPAAGRPVRPRNPG